MKTDFSAEDLDRLMPQAVGWLTKIELAKPSLTPAKARKLQARIDEAVSERLAESADRG
jgi:hypothetical protein